MNNKLLLPSHIIIKILEYLSMNERLKASLVCKQLCAAVRCQQLQTKTITVTFKNLDNFIKAFRFGWKPFPANELVFRLKAEEYETLPYSKISKLKKVFAANPGKKPKIVLTFKNLNENMFLRYKNHTYLIHECRSTPGDH